MALRKIEDALVFPRYGYQRTRTSVPELLVKCGLRIYKKHTHTKSKVWEIITRSLPVRPKYQTSFVGILPLLEPEYVERPFFPSVLFLTSLWPEFPLTETSEDAISLCSLSTDLSSEEFSALAKSKTQSLKHQFLNQSTDSSVPPYLSAFYSLHINTPRPRLFYTKHHKFFSITPISLSVLALSAQSKP